MRYFRPFESYALFLLQKHLVNEVSHLNPPSRKDMMKRNFFLKCKALYVLIQIIIIQSSHTP